MLLQHPVPDSVIRATADTVFSQSAYNRFSLWQRFWGWVFDLFRRAWALLDPLLSALRRSPVLYWTVIVLLGLLVLAIVGRAVYLWRQRRLFDAAALAWERSPLRQAGRDPWSAAEELSARGDYTGAAHALYAALLESAAQRGQIRLHPSKTAGDYVRELRNRSSAIFALFRDFARSYETVIYGIGTCDAERYRRLHALAGEVVHQAHANV